MARPRRQHQAEDAAKAASEAAKVLQQRGQEVKKESPEVVPEALRSTEPPENWEPPKRNDTRSRIMEEIVESRKGAQQEEPPAEVEVKPEPEPEPVKAETQPEPRVEPQGLAKPAMTRVKVDGEEYDAPTEEVEAYGGVRAYQTQKAAENRLKKQNEVLAEIRKMQSDLAEQLKLTQKPKEPEFNLRQMIVDKVDQLRFGTQDEAAATLEEIIQKALQAAHKPVDQNQIIEQATGRFWHDQAVKQFDSEFQDIVTNPDLLQLVVFKRNNKLAQSRGAPQDWNQFYRAIGNEVRALVGKPTSQQQVQSTTSGTPSQQSTKEERKASAAVSIPAASSRAAPPPAEKPQTRADVLKEMRQKRGLPVD